MDRAQSCPSECCRDPLLGARAAIAEPAFWRAANSTLNYSHRRRQYEIRNSFTCSLNNAACSKCNDYVQVIFCLINVDSRCRFGSTSETTTWQWDYVVQHCVARSR